MVLVEAPWQECIKYPSLLPRVVSAEAQWGDQTSNPESSNEAPIPPQLSMETSGELGLSPSPCYNPRPLPLRCQRRPTKMKDLNEIQSFTT